MSATDALEATSALGPIVAFGMMAGVLLLGWPRWTAYAAWALWAIYLGGLMLYLHSVLWAPTIIYGFQVALAAFMLKVMLRRKAAA